jgi:PAS domain S-box-containing protein
VWFMPYPRLLYDERGQIVGGVNMLLDITERKQAERATGLLAAIVDSSDDAIVSKNLNGVITSWNKAAERLLGYTADEAIGRHITLIIPSWLRDEEASILERLKRGERIDHFETVRVRKDGGLVDLSLTISPVKDATGRIVGASKVARDITERKRVEQELRDSQERLRTLAEGLENEVLIRTKELEQRNAHVVEQSEQLRELSKRLLRTQDDERRHIARELHDSAGQILTLLSINLSGINQRADGNPQLSLAVQEGMELVRQLSKEIRTMSYLLHPPLLDEIGLSESIRWYVAGLKERSNLDIDVSIADKFGRIPPDMELAVFRIVQECLTNIHRHSGSKTGTVRLSRTADVVTLEVEDAGQGIAADKLAAIQTRGAGVGIMGVRERIRNFGGTMNIECNGKGTKVSVTLPVAMSTGTSGIRNTFPQSQTEYRSVIG